MSILHALFVHVDFCHQLLLTYIESTAGSANNVSDFEKSCGERGAAAKCCSTPIAGLEQVCTPVDG